MARTKDAAIEGEPEPGRTPDRPEAHRVSGRRMASRRFF